MYIHRVLRVLPSYAFTLFVHWKVAPYFASGPNADYLWGFDTRACEEQWWKHLLFINNITPWWNQRFGNICFGHTWYLANDMQFFLLVPLFVVLYRYSKWGKKFAITGLLGLTAGCIAITWYLSVENHWSPSTWDAAENIAYTEEGFSRSWVRITPYTIGMMFGFMWYEKKVQFPNFKFSAFQRLTVLLLSLGILAACMFGPYKSDLKPCIITMGQDSADCGSQMNQFAKSALLALGRPAWTFGLGLLSILCWNGQGGYINKFLSAPIWTPISNLSFTTYLGHYTVLTYYIGQRVTRINFSVFEFVTMYFGLVLFSTMYALFIVLVVEKPFMKLQKKYLKF
jgi:peptidoglycan/LPS O-acetylase OafA/YrhL